MPAGASRLVSIHAPPRGATGRLLGSVRPASGFNPRPPAGGDVMQRSRLSPSKLDGFNPRPPRGGDLPRQRQEHVVEVSIHAPARGATGGVTTDVRRERFNPRPRVGGDGRPGLAHVDNQAFQSTPPPRGATHQRDAERVTAVSIHAPRVGGDVRARTWGALGRPGFNPRPPRGGRPRRGSRLPFAVPRFNPRPPRGGRPSGAPSGAHLTLRFQSTPPAWGATPSVSLISALVAVVSIHAPRVGGDAPASTRLALA